LVEIGLVIFELQEVEISNYCIHVNNTHVLHEHFWLYNTWPCVLTLLYMCGLNSQLYIFWKCYIKYINCYTIRLCPSRSISSRTKSISFSVANGEMVIIRKKFGLSPRGIYVTIIVPAFTIWSLIIGATCN